MPAETPGIATEQERNPCGGMAGVRPYGGMAGMQPLPSQIPGPGAAHGSGPRGPSPRQGGTR